MKNRIILILIIIVQVFKLSAQKGHGLNLRYSYSDVYYPGIIGGNNFIELNYLNKVKKRQFNIGIFKDIPYRYKIGTTIGLNIAYKYNLFRINNRFENFILTGINLAFNNYTFESYSYIVSNSAVYEYITEKDYSKNIFGFDLGSGFQINFSSRLNCQIGALLKSNLVIYSELESTKDGVFYPSYFLSLNYLIKCD